MTVALDAKALDALEAKLRDANADFTVGKGAEIAADAADAIAALRNALAEDAARLDWIELCIRDGSYLSIINDIAEGCHRAWKYAHATRTLRRTIDAVRTMAGDGLQTMQFREWTAPRK